ncbi:unnamed protein product [Plutella xylostella]|uniref:(diamondback moth) hypothetical protein n=1 Tax=Plutella xylostella TaxID=51655 RepID=A0A8S4DXP4_PLUXY|nr:unnamed protein product [Plutella xylostella]
MRPNVELTFKKSRSNLPADIKLEVDRGDCSASENDIDAADDLDSEMSVKSEQDEEKPKRRKVTARASTSRAAKKVKAEDAKKERPVDEFQCPHCDLTLTRMYNLKRHMLQMHSIDIKVTTKKLCEDCGRQFNNAQCLAKHLAIGCRKGMLCTECDKRFDTKAEVLKHMRLLHWREYKLTKLRCQGCGKSFASHEDHDAHLYSAHDIRLDYQELTFDCMEGASQIPLKAKTCPARIEIREEAELFLVTHQTVHLCDEEPKISKTVKTKVPCPNCDLELDCHEELNGHLKLAHNVDIDVEEFSFESYDAFLKWKEAEEKIHTVQFFKRSTNQNMKRGNQIRKTYYLCCRSGQSRGEKRKSSLKIGKICPAKIILTKEDSSEVYHVKYQSTHVGHGTEVAHTKLSKEDRALIAEKIKNGISLVKILEEAQKNEGRLKELRRVDLYNIIRDFNIDKTEVNYGTNYRRRDAGAVGKRKKKKQKGQESATPERIEHRVNLTTILQHSNASPFRDKTMRGFSCLYCAKSFPYIEDLRRHTAQQSEKDKLNTMIDYKLSYNPIKVDITDLICNICNSPMKDLNELKDHLTSAHDKFIHKDIKDIILPFRLMDGTNFTCVICSVVHISFKNLYLHMSSHYRNYCCNKCGVGYITIAALRKHMKTHEDGNFPCAYCDKVYSSKAKKRNHEKGVHTGGWLRNKCPHCPEIFVSYYDRSEHLVRVHNLAPVTYPCNACNKVYKKKFELNRHIKHHHLQQKNYMCDFCKLSFFSKRGLVDHMARHTGSDVFCCELCNKRFARLRTLKEHIRSHDNQKRYQCDVCKKTFMQKSSLKIHSKLHQDDLEIFKEFDDVKHLIDNRDLTLKQIAAESKQKAEEEKAAKAIGVL